MDDNDIIRRIKAGDAEAYSLLVEKYHRQLLTFIFRLVGDREIVEDLGQDIFFSVYKSLQDFDVERGVPFSAWLFISAKNRCISELRSRGKCELVSLDAVSELRAADKPVVAILIEKEQRQALDASLEHLPEPYRSTILSSLAGQSLEEIAKDQNVAPGTVKSRLSRAKEKLKLLVTSYFERRKGYEGV